MNTHQWRDTGGGSDDIVHVDASAWPAPIFKGIGRDNSLAIYARQPCGVSFDSKLTGKRLTGARARGGFLRHALYLASAVTERSGVKVCSQLYIAVSGSCWTFPFMELQKLKFALYLPITVSLRCQMFDILVY